MWSSKEENCATGENQKDADCADAFEYWDCSLKSEERNCSFCQRFNATNNEEYPVEEWIKDSRLLVNYS